VRLKDLPEKKMSTPVRLTPGSLDGFDHGSKKIDRLRLSHQTGKQHDVDLGGDRHNSRTLPNRLKTAPIPINWTLLWTSPCISTGSNVRNRATCAPPFFCPVNVPARRKPCSAG
jgi:hypothetical protein